MELVLLRTRLIHSRVGLEVAEDLRFGLGDRLGILDELRGALRAEGVVGHQVTHVHRATLRLVVHLLHVLEPGGLHVVDRTDERRALFERVLALATLDAPDERLASAGVLERLAQEDGLAEVRVLLAPRRLLLFDPLLARRRPRLFGADDVEGPVEEHQVVAVETPLHGALGRDRVVAQVGFGGAAIEFRVEQGELENQHLFHRTRFAGDDAGPLLDRFRLDLVLDLGGLGLGLDDGLGRFGHEGFHDLDHRRGHQRRELVVVQASEDVARRELLQLGHVGAALDQAHHLVERVHRRRLAVGAQPLDVDALLHERHGRVEHFLADRRQVLALRSAQSLGLVGLGRVRIDGDAAVEELGDEGMGRGHDELRARD